MDTITEQIEKFKKETGIKLDIKDGKPYYGGNLYLQGTAITSLPDNLVVGGWLDVQETAITSLPDNLVVGGWLDVQETAITSLPDNLVVGGSLYLRGTTITSLPNNLVVGDWLDLHGTAITSLPDNLVIGGWLDLQGSAITSLPDNLVIGGSLDLERTSITSLPDNLVVGGSLYLQCSAITSLPNNLVVGGSLYLHGTAITSLPKNLVVGRSLYLQETAITSLPDNLVVGDWIELEGTQITDTSNVNRNAPTLYEWNNKKYIKVDGIFSIVDNYHGNVYKVHKVGSTKQMYVVGDGNGKWAHGETIDKARKDLIYKISNRDKSAYKNLKLNSILTFEEAIECYRVITGSCAAGTKDYVENRLPKPHKEKYSIREMIKLTKGEYQGKEFEEFFKNNK